MKKRIISFALIIAVCFGSISVVGADISVVVQKMIDKMLQFSSADRENLFSLIKPMIVSDSGIDAITSLIEGYTPESTSMFDEMVGSFLKYIDKESAIKAVNSIKIIEPSIRRKYADLFRDRAVEELSVPSNQAMMYFISKTQAKYSGLERLMTEDNITSGVIAMQLKAFAEANEGKPIFTDAFSGSDDFSVFYISPTLKERAAQYLTDGNIESNSIIIAFFDKLNLQLNADEKTKLKQLGRELGLYTPFVDVLPSGVKSGSVYEKDSFTVKFTAEFDKSAVQKVITEGATVIEVSAYVGANKQDFGRLERPVTIKIPVNTGSVMAFRIDNSSLLPIKYSVCIENELYIRIEETGYYAISYKPKYFADANGWGGEYIEALYNRGIINGKAKGIFAPDDNITREEFVKLAVELFDIKADKYYANFSDVNHDEWYYPYVATAFKHGIVSGIGNNTFGVGQNISRQDICKLLSNVIKVRCLNFAENREYSVFRDDAEIDGYANESIELLYKTGIISGDENGYFNPKNNATRQEAAKIIHGILELYVKSTL